MLRLRLGQKMGLVREPAMVSCSVYFYRKILGVPFAAPQGKVRIRLARNQIRAVEAAKRRFARRLGLSDWRLGADAFDLVCPDPNEGCRPILDRLHRRVIGRTGINVTPSR